MPFRGPKLNYSYNHIQNPQDAQEVKKVFDRAYTKALKFLSYRPRSQKEIKDFLEKKGFDEMIITQVIELLRNQKIVNDEEFATWWTEQRQSARPHGKLFIKQELRQKGIDTSIIEETFGTAQDDFETAKTLFEKKRHIFEKYRGQEYKQKVATFFQRRGFSWDVVQKLLKKSDE